MKGWEKGEKKMNKEWVWWLKSYSRPNFPYLTKNPCNITMCRLWTMFFYISTPTLMWETAPKKYSSSIKPPSLCKRTSQKHLPAYVFPFLFLLSHTSSAGKQKNTSKAPLICIKSHIKRPINHNKNVGIKLKQKIAWTLRTMQTGEHETCWCIGS